MLSEFGGGGMWMAGLERQPQAPRTSGHDPTAMHKIRDLEHHVARLSLLNQALWELVRDRLNLSDADLEQMARAVDLRDGVEDGKMSDTPVACPTCGRVSNSKHYKCLYCGQLFEKPIMG